jgi:PEGA domain
VPPAPALPSATATATATADAPAARSGVTVACDQPGVIVSVDGDERKAFQLLGTTDLEPGEHVLRFTGDRYRPVQKQVTVTAGQVTDLGEVRLEVARGMATIRLVTEGARVLLVNGSDRREIPMTPISIDFDTTKSWVLHATKAGHCEYVQAIDFSDGVAKKTFEVELRPGCGH